MALSLLFPFHVCSGLIGFRLIRHKRVFFGQATSPLVRCKQISAPKFHRENICQGQKSFLKILQRHQRLIEHQFNYPLPSHAFLVRPGEGSGISGIFQSGLFFRISIQRAPLEQHSHVSCHLPLKRTWTTTRFHYKAITGVRNSRTINNMVFVNTSENVNRWFGAKLYSHDDAVGIIYRPPLHIDSFQSDRRMWNQQCTVFKECPLMCQHSADLAI